MRLIDADKLREHWLENGRNEKIYDTNDFLDSIDGQETVDAEPVRHGKWRRKHCNGYYKYVCSCCGGDITKDVWGRDTHTDYCSNCGAKMDLGEL